MQNLHLGSGSTLILNKYNEQFAKVANRRICLLDTECVCDYK